ncbi:MAG: acyltransferase family protein [Actinocatenispora sp.]
MTAVTARSSGWAQRIEAATPAGRDRTVDALRAVAVVGVVVGHWLVSALVSDPTRPDRLHGASPLGYLPDLSPVSWLLETLGAFFFAGGFAAARSLRGRAPLGWLGRRLSRLVRPVLVLLAVWLPAELLLVAVDTPADTRHVILSLVSHPLWFVLVYVVLTAATPVVRAAMVRCGLWTVAVPVSVVVLADLLRSGGLPRWLWVADVLAGWLVPYLLGVALAEGRLRGRGAGAVLLATGVLGGAALTGLAGYPTSAVGVPGDGSWSNLDPPSLFAVALSAAQIGLFLLVRPWLARWLRHPSRWAPVAAVNLVALTVFCWHQSALLLVTLGALAAGRFPGLHDVPRSLYWVVHRLAWFPVFLLALAVLTLVFRRLERRPG